MDFQEAQAHTEELQRSLMDVDPGWHSCSGHACQDECSRDDCTQMCDGSLPCEDASVCRYEDCAETACMSSCSSDPRHCLSMSVEASSQEQHALQDDGVSEHQGSIQCPWILPGEPCDVTVGTRNALGRHIYEQHIDPQLTLQCPLRSCSEIMEKGNLPNHQAQQHHPENYPCSWDSCADTYATSDGLFNHIMTSHGYLDCHFGGCEVSLKDPMQLQNHVVEDHLDYGFGWVDNPIFDSRLPLNNNPGFDNFSSAMPRAGSYPIYESGGAHLQMQYNELLGPYAPTNNPSTNGFQNTIGLCVKIPEQQKRHRTFTEEVESVWQNSKPFRPSPPGLSKNDSDSAIASPACGSNPTTICSEHGSQQDGHICKWIVDSLTHRLCNRAFHTAEDLQKHLCKDHCKQTKSARSAPKIKAICRWDGCGRKEEPLNDTHKLIRHVLTHSDHRAFDCNHCGKVFKTKCERDNHERMHRGEKPFKCEVCGKACSNETQLTIHRRTHTGEKPYQCDICSFSCADSTNLNKHKKTHGPKEFRCDICGSEFGRKHTLERHQRTVHLKMHVATDPVTCKGAESPDH